MTINLSRRIRLMWGATPDNGWKMYGIATFAGRCWFIGYSIRSEA